MGEVMRHQLGLRFDHLGKPLHEGVGNPTVKLLTLASHHRGIGCILNQRMFEDVSRIWWLTAGEDQLASRKVCKSVLQRGARDRNNRSEQTIWELATYDRANLRDLLDRAKPIKTRRQRT